MKIKGKVWKYGDNINTDYIIPGRYMELTDPEEISRHVFEEYDPDFITNVQTGDLVIGASNFGCGSSREHAPLALKYVGVSCVLAESFARIFYRNCINIGLPALECEAITKAVKDEDEVEVNLGEGIILNISCGTMLKFKPLPRFMLEVLKAGGLAHYLNKAEEW